MAVLVGIHAVEEALAAGQQLERLLLVRGRGGGRIERLLASARGARVPVRFVSRQEADRLADSERHQGVVAISGAAAYADLEDLLEAVGKRSSPALFVVLDGIEDPHNLGAIIRTAHCAGADGVILPERRAAGVTPAVARASAGAVAHIPIARVTNLARALVRLKQAGCWIVGLDPAAAKDFTQVDLTHPTALVLGSEGRGLRALVREKCDFRVSVPTLGSIPSLNVSVAAGVVLYEAVRQRRAKAASD